MTGSRTLVTGANGLLGSEFVRALERRGYETVALARADLDVTDADAVARRMRAEAPDRVIHCAAYTAVDRAEAEPELAMRVNRDGAVNVATASDAVGARLVHISTDYVFDGRKREPYLPDDPVGPLSVYGKTKLAGERAVLEVEGAMVVRTSWLYGAGRPTFLTAMIERARSGAPLRIVADERNRPTWTRDAAEAVLGLLDDHAEGIWHVAGGGDATRLDLVRTALELLGIEADVGGVAAAEWDAPAARPPYSVLDVRATEARLGRPMTHWTEALEAYLAGEGETGAESLEEQGERRGA